MERRANLGYHLWGLMILFLWMKHWNIQSFKRIDSTDGGGRNGFETSAVLIALAAAIFFGCIVSPPSLMDDVDAVQAQIARNMLDRGDWVIAHLDGVPYLEKSPLIYWMIAISYRIFGVHDWAARIPVAFAAVASRLGGVSLRPLGIWRSAQDTTRVW